MCESLTNSITSRRATFSIPNTSHQLNRMQRGPQSVELSTAPHRMMASRLASPVRGQTVNLFLDLHLDRTVEL
jgi:hypothetical protein